MHIQLDRLGAQLDGTKERGYGVLRQRLVRAAVGDDFRRSPAS
jgi:hypothetical protein